MGDLFVYCLEELAHGFQIGFMFAFNFAAQALGVSRLSQAGRIGRCSWGQEHAFEAT